MTADWPRRPGEATSGAHALRRLMDEPGMVLLPGVANAFDARIAERVGYRALFTTGSGIANMRLGLPDLGLTTMSEVLGATARIVDSVGVPVVADADTGYGNHVNAYRTAREFMSAGVAAIVLEDQVSPKRCGHFGGKRVVPVEEMVEKICAVRLARGDGPQVIVGRSDSIAPEGFDAAIERGIAYVEAGADVIFLEGPTSLDQVKQIPSLIPAPVLLCVVEGGVSPVLPAPQLEDMGYKFALYPNLALRMAATAVERGLRTLLTEGSTDNLLGDMYEFEVRQDVVRLPYWEELDERIGSMRDDVLARRGAAYDE